MNRVTPKGDVGEMRIAKILCLVVLLGIARTWSQTPEVSSTPKSVCDVTADRDQLVGKGTIVAGRVYLNGISTDAPWLLRDGAACTRTCGVGNVLVFDVSNLGQTARDGQFRRYQEDLVRNPCRRCIPRKVARYWYVDIVAKGKLETLTDGFRGYCGTFHVEHILETKSGPLTKSVIPDK